MKAKNHHQITDYISYSNFLSDKFLGSSINEEIISNGAIGQIDLVGSTAFTVSKTTVRETLEKEAEIFEANLSGNKLDFEDEMLLTRNDLIKRDIIYGVKSIAYNGILIGKMRLIASWLGLETLGTEGDKIIVYGENPKNVLIFCITATLIFKKKSKKGLQGFGFRCGVASVDEENPLTQYKNSDGLFLTCKGTSITNAEFMEANAKGNEINVAENLLKSLEHEFSFKKSREGFFFLDQTKSLSRETRNHINSLLKNFEDKDLSTPSLIGNNFSITKKTPIAFIRFELDKNIDEKTSIKNFLTDLKKANLLLLRFGVIKDHKTVLICHPDRSSKPSSTLLNGFQFLLEKNYKIKVGLTHDYLWVGNITFFNDERSNFDVMGQSINLAARIVYKTEIEAPSILGSESFLQSLNEEGFDVNSKTLECTEFLAKGFDKPMHAFNLNNLELVESEFTRKFRNTENFSQIIVDISNAISNILFEQSQNFYFAINSANFLISKLILFSGMNQDYPDEEIQNIQKEDFLTLANVVLANLKKSKNIIDAFENTIAKIPDLNYPHFILKNLDSETLNDLKSLSLITFGRVYDFKISTLKNALSFEEKKIKKYESQKLLWINRKRVFARLQPPLAYILDLRASDLEREKLHKTISLYLWKQMKKEQKGTRIWYEKGRVLALHSKFTNSSDLPLKLKNLLVEIFEYAIAERELLDLLIFENSLLDKISNSAKKDLFYELALVNLKFNDTAKALEILNSIKKFRKTESLTQKVDFFIDVCVYKLQIALDHGEEQKRILSNQKVWQMMNEEEIQIAENILEV